MPYNKAVAKPPYYKQTQTIKVRLRFKHFSIYRSIYLSPEVEYSTTQGIPRESKGHMVRLSKYEDHFERDK